MTKNIIDGRAVLFLALALALAACTSAVVKPATPPEAQPETRALQFYEFYSPL